MSIPQNFDLQAELAKCKTADDLTGKNGLVQRLIGNMLEQMLQRKWTSIWGMKDISRRASFWK